MRFQAPQLGALGVTFTGLRLLQCVSLVAIVGLLANFIQQITAAERGVPEVMTGTITVASIAVLYSMISYILYYDNMLPLLIAAGADAAMLIALIVAAATTGKPLSTLHCGVLPHKTGGSSMTKSAKQTFSISVPDISVSYVRRGDQGGELRPASYAAFVAQDQPHCMEVKAVWGLSIAACCLFAFSALVCAGLWLRIRSSRKAAASAKDVEAAE